jgi:SAM-dependent methyltransferase
MTTGDGAASGSPDLYAGEADVYDVTTDPYSHTDVPFYQALAAGAGGAVLELGCGSGRVLVPCAEAAGEAWGVDSSPAMLALAADRAGAAGVAGEVNLVEGDLRSVRLERTFPLVTIPFRTLFLLRSDAEWQAALTTAKAHLDPGGVLAADVFVPDAVLLGAGERIEFTGEYPTPDGGRLAVWDHWRVDVAAQVMHRRRVTERLDPDGLVTERRHRLLDIFYRWPADVGRLFEQAGLEIVERFGDFDGGPFGDGAEDLVILARSW